VGAIWTRDAALVEVVHGGRGADRVRAGIPRGAGGEPAAGEGGAASGSSGPPGGRWSRRTAADSGRWFT
jgi:hypothetical protein